MRSSPIFNATSAMGPSLALLNSIKVSRRVSRPPTCFLHTFVGSQHVQLHRQKSRLPSRLASHTTRASSNDERVSNEENAAQEPRLEASSSPPLLFSLFSLLPRRFSHHNNSFISTLFRWLRRAFVGALLLCTFSLTLLAATPALLANPTGLQAALNIINVIAPVKIHVNKVSGGSWKKPVLIQGLQIAEKHTGNPIKVPATAEDIQPSGFNGNNNQGDTIASAATVSQTPKTLVKVEKLRTTSSLLSLIQGQPTDILVHGAEIDLSLNSAGKPALLDVLEKVGLAPKPRSRTGSTPLKKVLASAPDSMQYASAAVSFSAELFLPRGLHIAVPPGESRLLIPAAETFQDVIGEDLHVQVLVGRDTIQAEEQVVPVNGEEGGILRWFESKPQIESAVESQLGSLKSPLAVRVDSSALQFTLAGWSTSRGYTYLTRPLEAKVHLTPNLARGFLMRVNPLLGNTVELRDNSLVAVSIASPDSFWPSNSVNIRVEPLHVKVGQGCSLTKALDVVKIANARVAAAAKAATLKVDLTPINIEINDDGNIKARQTDILVGIPGLEQPFKLLYFGTASTALNGPLDMTLCIPKESLNLIGFAGLNLPDDFAIPISVKGTVAAPKLEIMRASKEVALLVLENKAKQAGPRSAEWIWEELRLGGRIARFKTPEDA